MSDRLEFESEIPIPTDNVLLYRRIYVLEQWLRRLLLAGLMSRYATQWRSAIPTEVSKDLKGRRVQLRARTFLDVESSDNDVWLLTLEELRRMLLSDYLWPAVRELTAWQKTEVGNRIEELREIRNVVGHNRATTERTVTIFDGIERYLVRGIEEFKRRTLYRDAAEGFSEDDADPLAPDVAAMWDGKTRQVILNVSEKFYSVLFLPVPPFTFLSIPDLLEAFHPARHSILAFYVNDNHNEFSVVWPRGATEAEHQAVLQGFRDFAHFTEAPYASQDGKYICDPRIWFYSDASYRAFSEDV